MYVHIDMALYVLLLIHCGASLHQDGVPYTVEPLYKGHLSNEGTVCSPNHIELCTNLPLN